MKVKYLVALTALTLGIGTLAYAKHGEGDSQHHGSHHSLEQVDTNKDGAVSRDEFMAHHQKMAAERFAKMDANNDGKVDEAERNAMKAKMKEKMGKHCDRESHDEHGKFHE